MSPVIETERLTRRFGRSEAVSELSFAVPEGSIYALLGPNGAGKSTTIKVLLSRKSGQPRLTARTVP